MQKARVPILHLHSPAFHELLIYNKLKSSTKSGSVWRLIESCSGSHHVETDVHHSDDKTPSVPSNITNKLHNVVNKDMMRLGRKDLKPKVKQPTVFQDKKEPEEHQVDEIGNETEPEDLVHDHEREEHEDMKHEEDHENEEETTEGEHDLIKIKKTEVNKEEGQHSDGGEEIKEKVNEKVNNEQNKVIVLEKEDEKKMNSSMKVENVSSEVGPSVDLSTLTVSKEETIQHMNTSQDSNLMPSVDLKNAVSVNRNSEDSMNSNGEDENQKEQESNENENENNEESEVKNEEGGVLEEEKEALTDLGTLPESGIGGSRSTENTAAE
ncbi:unnamed protein product [Lactuca virosa]|uniref:Uncharacterized protein n=1 Tax=Lactuca virosa TaxID=75947 RepID=A0AAU9NI23_9ASTR|nr:unnamed protein product [Lactuca virosa]